MIGTPTVYTAGSRSLAILEMLVHVDLRHELPSDRILVTIEVPDQLINNISGEELPMGWDSNPPNLESQGVFTAFAKRGGGVLRVPSTVVPAEFNFLLNPLSPKFDVLSVENVQPLNLCERLSPSSQ